MKKVIIYLEGMGENEKALAIGYAAERVLNEAHMISGRVTVKSMDGRNWLQRLLSRPRSYPKVKLLKGGRR